MVIYEVNLAVDQDVRDEYLDWLREHVSQMLAIDGFNAAEIYRREDDDDGRDHYCVSYRLSSREHLDEYFHGHAERMRADGQDRFGGRFSASRRILHPVI